MVQIQLTIYISNGYNSYFFPPEGEERFDLYVEGRVVTRSGTRWYFQKKLGAEIKLRGKERYRPTGLYRRMRAYNQFL